MIPKLYALVGWNSDTLCAECARLEKEGHKVYGMELRNGITNYPYVETHIIKFMEHSPAELEAWREMAKKAGKDFPETVEMPPAPARFEEPEKPLEWPRMSHKQRRKQESLGDDLADAFSVAQPESE